MISAYVAVLLLLVIAGLVLAVWLQARKIVFMQALILHLTSKLFPAEEALARRKDASK